MLWRAQALPVFPLHSLLRVAVILIVSRCSWISAEEERRAWGLKECSSWVPPYLPSQKSCPDLHLCLGLQLQGSLERGKDCFVFLIYFCLHWVFVASWAFPSCSEWGLLSLVLHGLLTAVAFVTERRFSCPVVCGIFLDQESHCCPLHWQPDS